MFLRQKYDPNFLFEFHKKTAKGNICIRDIRNIHNSRGFYKNNDGD